MRNTSDSETTALERNSIIGYHTVTRYVDGVPQVFAFPIPAEVETSIMSAYAYAFILSERLAKCTIM